MNRVTKNLFRSRGYDTSPERVEDSDIVVWQGGEDIDPSIYKQKCLPCTFPNKGRDIEDVGAYNIAIGGQLLVGICRGAQLLNCLNGGSMWQDIDRHGGGYHTVKDFITGDTHTINSLHHQQMIIGTHGELWAYSTESTRKMNAVRTWDKAHAFTEHMAVQNGIYEDVDPEVAWYPATRSLCFQAHPEFGHKETTDYFFDLIDRAFAA